MRYQKRLVEVLLLIGFFFLIKLAVAAPPESPYKPNETLDPACKPNESNCYVQPLWLATSTGVYSYGKVGIGINNPQSLLHILSTTTQQEGNWFILEGVQDNNIILRTANQESAGRIPRIYLLRADGSLNSPSPTRGNQWLGAIEPGGYETQRGWTKAGLGGSGEGGIIFESAGDWTPTSHPFKINFKTVDINSTFGVSRMVIDHRGNVGIGTPNPLFKLEVKGIALVSEGIATKVSSGTISDSSFNEIPPDGLLVIDSANGRLYVKYNDSWHYFSQTAGFQIPVEEVGNLKVGDIVVGKIDKEMSDKALHGVWVSLNDVIKEFGEAIGVSLKEGILSFKQLFVDKLIIKELCSSTGKCLQLTDEVIDRLNFNQNSYNFSLPVNNPQNFLSPQAGSSSPEETKPNENQNTSTTESGHN